MHLITEILVIMTIVKSVTLFSCYLNRWMAFKKPTKWTKSILVTIEHLKSFGIDQFLNTLHLSIPLNFVHPKIRIVTQHTHSYIIVYMWTYRNVQIWMSSCFLKLISKTLQYSHIWNSLMRWFKMGSRMFLAVPVLKTCILGLRNRWSLRKFSKSGDKISNFCVFKIDF